MGLGEHSEYYQKGSQTWKENWSVQCGQSVRNYGEITNISVSLMLLNFNKNFTRKQIH